MDKLIELLKQIQELAGVGIDALEGAAQGGGSEGAPAPEPDGDEAAPSGPPPQA